MYRIPFGLIKRQSGGPPATTVEEERRTPANSNALIVPKGEPAMSAIEPDLIRSTVAELAPAFIAVRHTLHANPELSDHEQNTAALVAAQLRSLNMDEVRTGVGGHGVVATLRGSANGAAKGRTLALRADMDALPIQETADLPYRSCIPGVMHACGHDGHTSTLLGAAATLGRLRDQIRGTVRFVFQPSEEVVGGAVRMCAAGAIEGVDAIVALHGWPGLELRQIGVRSGPSGSNRCR